MFVCCVYLKVIDADDDACSLACMDLPALIVLDLLHLGTAAQQDAK